jgi:PDZ domain-containing protein
VHLWTAASLAGGLVVAVVLLAAFVQIPYFSLAPGEARETAPLVSVQGEATYDTGQILFLTISLKHVTLLQGAAGWADPDTQVVPEHVILGDGTTEEENRQANQVAMANSKDEAQVVALSRLGYELHPTGTGAFVTDITAGTPAEEALSVGDTLVAVDGQPISFPADLGDLISAHTGGDEVTLTVETDADDGTRSSREEQVALARCGDIDDCAENRPDEPDSAFLGVATEARDFDPGLPFQVGIDSGAVGGPSAGLAFTLTLLDVLTPGDLTGGHRVAVTGTIEDGGVVGPVGGVVQKAAAAAAAGAEVMLVPRDEEPDATTHSHGMQVIAVDDLDDALIALEDLGGDPLPDAARPERADT